MLFERCKSNEASIHLTEIIKDVKSEVHLCESCARKIGLNAKLSSFSLSVPEMLSFLDVNEVEDASDTTRCAVCGLSFIEYNRDGKLGCPECYHSMKGSLDNIIVSFHGEKRHIGKIPDNDGDRPRELEPALIKSRQSITDLKRQMEIAVSEERYEDAAVLRDSIRDLENR